MTLRLTEAEFQAMQRRVSGGRLAPVPSDVSAPSTLRQAQDARSPYRSKLEAAYAGYLHTLLLAGDVELYRYEPVTLRLADDVRYTPDFWVTFKDGREEYHEVKGYSKGLLASKGMVKVKVAASHWPKWTFVLVTRQRGIWNLREMR